MGIYDREYYRREGPSFLESFTGRGKVCKWLILINVLIWVAQVLTEPAPYARDEEGNIVPREVNPERFGDRSGAVTEALWLAPDAVSHGQVWRLLSYSFLHAGIWHILFNMLFLWWFGHEMEEMYGSREFLLFYLVSAFLGGVAYYVWALARGVDVPCVGASGAVTAAMVLYAFHFPTRVIYIWFVLPVPIWLFVAFQVAQDLFLFSANVATTTAVTVHLAGAAFAFGYYKLNWRLAPWWDALRRLRLPTRSRPRLRVYEDTPPRPVRASASAPPPAAAPEVDEQLEAKVDAVLEKVARHGRDSLTESEKQLLVKASEVYKRRHRS
jgi:membrane associated rhomboid family serine protease